jgi:hypothetical protein
MEPEGGTAMSDRDELAMLIAKAKWDAYGDTAVRLHIGRALTGYLIPTTAAGAIAEAILASAWLAGLKREWQAEALEDASSFTTPPDVTFHDLSEVRDWLRDRAASLRSVPTKEKP